MTRGIPNSGGLLLFFFFFFRLFLSVEVGVLRALLDRRSHGHGKGASVGGHGNLSALLAEFERLLEDVEEASLARLFLFGLFLFDLVELLLQLLLALLLQLGLRVVQLQRGLEVQTLFSLSTEQTFLLVLLVALVGLRGALGWGIARNR